MNNWRSGPLPALFHYTDGILNSPISGQAFIFLAPHPPTYPPTPVLALNRGGARKRVETKDEEIAQKENGWEEIDVVGLFSGTEAVAQSWGRRGWGERGR